MFLTLALIVVLTFLATYIGGLFALSLRDRLHLVLGFSAGAILAVAFFDLLPEAVLLGTSLYSVQTVFSFTALGFVAYLLLDRLHFFHSEDSHEGHAHRGTFGAGSLSLHSFLDGVAIGLAFHAGTAVGAVVALAVLAHDFSDGINTVNFIVRDGGSRKKALKWLSIDATAPALGVIVAQAIHLPQASLGIVLAVFAGFFIYMGASDLIPESHHNHPRFMTTLMTILGFLVLYSVIRLVHM